MQKWRKDKKDAKVNAKITLEKKTLGECKIQQVKKLALLSFKLFFDALCSLDYSVYSQNNKNHLFVSISYIVLAYKFRI